MLMMTSFNAKLELSAKRQGGAGSLLRRCVLVLYLGQCTSLEYCAKGDFAKAKAFFQINLSVGVWQIISHEDQTNNSGSQPKVVGRATGRSCLACRHFSLELDWFSQDHNKDGFWASATKGTHEGKEEKIHFFFFLTNLIVGKNL